MKSNSHNPEEILHQFDEWLRSDKVPVQADFMARTRVRLNDTAEADADAIIDQLLKQDARLSNPFMAARVRQRIEASQPNTVHIPWFQWASSLAAAVVLGFAFFAFQSSAPVNTANLDSQQTPLATNVQGTTPDSELTQIFALASNLDATTDLSRLQSVDDYAFLLE